MKGFINAAQELLRPNLDTRPHRMALLYRDQKISFTELFVNSNRFGNALLALGLHKRDRIVIQMPDCPECVFAFLGSIQAGLWPILISPDLGAESRNHILCDSTASAFLTRQPGLSPIASDLTAKIVVNLSEKSVAELFNSASSSLSPHQAHPEDIAFLLYSSGSTGKPKGVPHRHADMLFCADSYGANVLGISDADRHFSAGKLYFAYGLGNSLFLPLRFGASTILYDAKPSPSEIFRIIETCSPTLFFGVPALYSLLVKSFDPAAKIDSLRLCVSAGEALPAAIVNEWKRLTGLDILDGIGSTEALHIFISNYPGQVRAGSSGCVVPPFEAAIVNDEGNPVADGEPGNLMIKGQSLAKYYWNSPQKTADTMLKNGWAKTGDIYVCHDGIYTYQGRSDDVFKVDARWVSPAHVEDTLKKHPSVLECAVTSRRLEGLVKPVAHVVLNDGFVASPALEKELRLFAREQLPDHMCPVQVDFRDSLPRTDTGKIQRYRLRQAVSASSISRSAAEAGGSVATMVQTQNPERLTMKVTSSDIVNLMKDAGISPLILERLKMNVSLAVQGLDSIDLPSVAAATEKQYNLDLSDADASKLKTVDDYVRFVNEKLS